MQKGKRKAVDTANRREIFTVLGKIGDVQGRKRFIPHSQPHLNASLSRLPLGTELAVTFSEHIPIRSRGQLAYHMVLMGYVSDYTGHTRKEMHDFVMRVVFGEKEIAIGNITKKVRESVSDDARMPKAKMAVLIQSDLALCKKLGIDVPTPKQLGYISNDAQYIDADHTVEDDAYPVFDGPTAFD